MLVFNVDEIKKCLNDVVGEDKMYALGLLEWAIDKRSIEAIPIFDDVTNGDMIKAMFPNAKVVETNGSEIGLRPKGQSWVIWFTQEWWNSPYQDDT